MDIEYRAQADGYESAKKACAIAQPRFRRRIMGKTADAADVT